MPVNEHWPILNLCRFLQKLKANLCWHCCVKQWPVFDLTWWKTDVVLEDIGGVTQTQSAGQPPRRRNWNHQIKIKRKERNLKSNRFNACNLLCDSRCVFHTASSQDRLLVLTKKGMLGVAGCWKLYSHKLSISIHASACQRENLSTRSSVRTCSFTL